MTDIPGSYWITWKNPDGDLCRNQVWAENRDKAIWRIALLMQTSQPHRTEFVSCEPERVRTAR